MSTTTTDRAPPSKRVRLDVRLYSFDGREARSGYIRFLVAWLLFVVLANVMLDYLYVAFRLGTGTSTLFMALLLTGFVILAPMILAATCRRCHDVGWTGWAQLATLVPFINVAFILYLVFRKSEMQAYLFGPVPLGVAT